jgi:hypothetical protein
LKKDDSPLQYDSVPCPVVGAESHCMEYAAQKTIFITSTISLGSEVSSIDDTDKCPNCGSVTLLDARFPNQG